MNALVDNRRAHMLRYTPWIARDYLTNQGPSTLIVLLLISFLMMQGAGGMGRFQLLPNELVARLVRGLIGTLAFLGTFFATNGIIANDRKFSYYRFLFSKPVSPLVYYGVVFVVYGLGLLVVTAALLGVWSYMIRPMFPLELFPIVLLMYMAYGGIGFLLSAAWRFDWLSLVTVLFVANVLWQVWGETTGIRYWFLHVLPPVHKADAVYAIVMAEAGASIPWSAIAWLGGYGLVCFIIGLAVLRRRSMATS